MCPPAKWKSHKRYPSVFVLLFPTVYFEVTFNFQFLVSQQNFKLIDKNGSSGQSKKRAGPQTNRREG